MDFYKKLKSDEVIDLKAFETACGVGIVVTSEDIHKGIDNLFE